ncbi:MAG: HNH endonuclease, partial [Bdellovibrionales bacterium]|nr:HNH endonuclease [Bdellovibrionales bacterium]
QASARYKTAEIDLINILDQVEQNRVYLRYGYNSLFQYGVQCLGLSDGVVYALIAVTRKSREVPELKEEIKQGRLTVSKAKRITSVITNENKTQWLELAKTSTQSKVEREVAKVNPQEARKGKMTYVHPQNEIQEKVAIQQQPTAVRVQLQVGISETLMIKIRRAQDLMSQKAQKPANLEATLESMVDLFLAKHDPLKKAERQIIRGKLCQKRLDEKTQIAIEIQAASVAGHEDQRSTEPSVAQTSIEPSIAQTAPELSLRRVPEMTASTEGPKKDQRDGKTRTSAVSEGPYKLNRNTQIQARSMTKKAKSKRRPVPAATKHRVMLKFAGQCSHVNHQGERCRETKFLEIHHLKPIALGGGDHLENLTLLCSGHHQAQHLSGPLPG